MMDSINSTASANSVAAAKALQEASQSKSVKGNEEIREPKGAPDIDDTAQISSAAQKASETR